MFTTFVLLAHSPRCLTRSPSLLIYTGRVNQQHASVFISRSGQKQKYEDAGLQEGKPWQPDIKMVQESSRTSQVAGGQTKQGERGGKEQVILKS